MKEVYFPILQRKISISKTFLSIGSVDIYWYSVMIVIAILITVICMKKERKKYGIYYDDVLQLMTFLLPISLICARAYYIAFNLKYYITEPKQILNTRNGGLAIYGGILGGCCFILVYCKLKKINVLDIFDFICPYLALGQSIGRWGNFFNIEAYGKETNNFLRMGIIENNKYIEVHPTFLYESIATFLICIILFYHRNKRKYKGQLTLIYFISYCFVRMFIEEIRADALVFFGLKISQIVSILILVICVMIVIFKKYYKITNK